MVWPLAQAVYFMIGGSLALLLVPDLARRGGTAGAPVDPIAAFALVFSVTMLWPLLVALIMDQGNSK